jgi:hypothetical protein
VVTYKGRPVAEAEGIVDRATWDRAQAILADPARAPRKGRPHSTLLGGLLTCGTCGAALRPSSNSVNRGGRIPTYACEPHRHVNRSRDGLDLFVREALAAHLAANAAAISERMPEADGTRPLLAEIAHLEKQADALADLLASGSLDAADYASASKKVRTRIEALKKQRHEAAGTPATGRLLLTATDVGAAVRGLDRERFRAVLGEVVESVTVPAGGGAPAIAWRAA